MIEINLIPDVKKELLRTRSMRNFIISVSLLVGSVSIVAMVVLGVILGGQFGAEALQEATIRDKSRQLSQVADLNKVVTIQNQLGKISEQHSNKRMTSRVFDTVSAVSPAAPNDVKFSAIKLNPQTKTITLEGTAVNGYSALETLKKTILNTKIRVTGENHSEEKLTEGIKDGDTSFGESTDGRKVLQFSFSFEYPDQLLAVAKSGNVVIVTPTSKTDVTDSRLSVPESLFGGKEEKSSERRAQ